GNAGLLVHRLVRQRTEFGAQCCNHPARKIEIATLSGAEMLLDGDHLLLADEAVPAAERLGVLCRISLICRHVTAHDASSIAGDVQTRAETVLHAHACSRFSCDAAPVLVAADDLFKIAYAVPVFHEHLQ